VIADYSPTRFGSSYFSFRLGTLWGLVLDCGEDKPDSHPEYGNTNCCHAFRRDETKYIESVIKNSASEYAADGVNRKLIISHSPFTRRFSPPFNIEEETYTYWAKLLSENVKPDLMLAGHTHTLEICAPGDENDAFGQPCTLVIASRPDGKRDTHAGGGFLFEKGRITVVMIEGDTVISETVLNI
jgi:hypothetical protein